MVCVKTLLKVKQRKNLCRLCKPTLCFFLRNDSGLCWELEKVPRGLGCGAGLKEPGTEQKGRGDPDVGLVTRKGTQGPLLRVPLPHSEPDRSGIVLNPGQTRGRETLPCSLWKIKKQETKVGRGK